MANKENKRIRKLIKRLEGERKAFVPGSTEDWYRTKQIKQLTAAIKLPTEKKE